MFKAFFMRCSFICLCLFRTQSTNSINFVLSRKIHFFKTALNRLLTLAKDRSRREILESSGIIDLQNNGVLKQFKHWNFRILVPMSYISLWDHFGSQNVDFSLILHRFYKQNVILTKKCQYFVGFIRVGENKCAVAAASVMGGPPFSSHSNIFFENVVKLMVLATFCMQAEARRCGGTLTSLINAPEPL